MICNYYRSSYRLTGMVLMFCLLLSAVPVVEAIHPVSSKVDIIGRYPEYPQINYAQWSDSGSIKRGEYLAKLGDCIACHTNPQAGTAAFAGGLPIPTPFGTFFTPNITPDKTTGIGNWSEADFIQVMHEGILPDGSNTFPAFPYVYFNRVSIADLKDLWAYLRTIPAVNQKNKGNTLPFIVDWRIWQYGWKTLYFNSDKGFFKQQTAKSDSWNRGAYLVNGLGHCTMCHTPMNLLGGEKKKYFLTGSMIEGYWAPDITQLGLKTASHYQVADVFHKGELINKAGPVRGPMADANHDSLQYLTEYDRLAIAEYLQSVVSQQPRNLQQIKAGQSVLKRGQQVYSNVCVMCHLNGEAGAPRIGDQPNWEQRLASNNLSALYSHAINGFNKMPVKGACVTCSDADVVAGVDYLLYHSLQHSYWKQLKDPKPEVRTVSTSMKLGKQIYEKNCSACHDQGKLGSPVIGARQQWAARIEQNMEILILNTLHGKNKMPPRGGCNHCTGSEIIAAVKYMVQQSQVGKNYSLW